MNIPDLRFPEFDGAWDEKQLNQLLEFKNGVNASKDQFGTGIKFINVLDILENDFIVYDKIIGRVDIDDGTLMKFAVNYGDILFQRSSETREEVGTACVYLDMDKTATFGGFVIRGKKIGNYEPVFLNNLLKTDLARKEITTKSGGSTRYNVRQETLASVIIPIPTLPEQQKIASFFTAIDLKITQFKNKKTLLEQYKNGVMQKIFSQKIRFMDDSGLEFPKWKNKRLGDVCKFIGGGTPDTSIEEYWGGDIQWFTPTEIKSDYVSNSERTISELGLKKSSAKRLPMGAILLTTRATIGDCAIAEKECTTNQGFQSLIVNDNSHNVFLLNWLKKNKNELVSRANGSTFIEINKTEIERISIMLPSFKEQSKIADFFSAIDLKINNTQIKIEKAELWKKGLLQKMFV